MAQMEDVARLRLEILGDEAERTVDSLKEGLGDVNAQLRLMETNGKKGSDEWRELKNLQKDINTEMRQTARSIDVNTASINDLTKAKRVLTQDLKKLEIGSKEWLEKMDQLEPINRKLNETNDQVRNLGREAKEQDGFWVKFKANFAAAFTLEAVMGAGRAIMDFGKQVFDITAKFEKYKAVLTNALGSTDKAKDALQRIKNLAAETPFSVDELTESYVKYVNRGIQPTMAEMRKLGDIAASQGKSFDQLTEAVLDATTGEFERLKEFGIRASKSGNEVELSFKGIQQTVLNTPDAIQGAILAFGELEGVAGGMAAISETLEGRTSNLGDKYDSLMVTIGEGLYPVFSAILDAMDWGIDVVSDLFTESEPLNEVFRNMGEILVNLWGSITRVFNSMFDLGDSSITTRDVINGLSIVFQNVSTAIRIAIAVFQGMFDGMNAVINKGKQLANFFGADFKIDPSATFEKMASNFQDNMVSIQTSWKKTVSEIHVNNQKDELDRELSTQNKKYELEKARIRAQVGDNQQKFDDLKKLEEEHNENVRTLSNESLKKQATTRLKHINDTATSEEQRAEQTEKAISVMKSDWTKKEIEEFKKAETSKTELSASELKKIATAKKKEAAEEEKLREKTEKDTAELYRKLDKMATDAIEDDLTRKKVQLMQKFELELEALDKEHVSKEDYAKLETALKDQLIKDIQALDDKAAKEAKVKDDARLESIKLAEFATKKAIIENELLNEKLTINQKLTLRRELRTIEYYEEIMLLEQKAKKTKEIEGISSAEIKAIDDKLYADKLLAAGKFTKDVEEIDKKMIPSRGKIFAQLKDLWNKLLDGDIETLKMFAGLAIGVLGGLLDKVSKNIDEQMQQATTAVERQKLEMKKAWVEVGNQALNAVSLFLSGNIVGGIAAGIGTVFSALSNWINKSANEAKARLEDLKQELEEAGKQFMEFANGFTDAIDPSKIEEAYQGLYKMSQLEPTRMDLGEYDTYERRMKQELEIANSINKNYDTAIKREDEYNKKVIAGINAAYDREVQRIEEKYSLLDEKSNIQLTEETLKIREAQAERLAELITNEDEKTKILEEYAELRNKITQTFSLADQVITEETDAATIKAINDARAARTNALAELQGKLNAELSAIANSEDGKRKELSATEKIAKDAEEAIDQLKMENAAADILRTKEKNQELADAAKAKNDALASEEERYNDIVTQLGLAKDAALAESFTILKDLIKNGYDEMMQKALDAYNAGKITADQYNEISAKLFQIQGQINGIDWGKFTIPNFDWNFNLPRFESGGFIPSGPSHAQGGIKLWNDKTKMFQGEIEGGEPILSKLTYANNKPIVDMLLHSSIHRNGASIRGEGGSYVNYLQAGHYANGGIIGRANVDFPASFTTNQKSVDTMARMTAATERAAETLRDIAAIQAAANELLSGIKEKKTGISLHEINDAAQAQADVNKKSML